MTPFKIPESAFVAIQSLIRLSETDFESFLTALSRAEPSLDQDLFWSHVAKHAGKIDASVIKAIVHEVFVLDDARSQQDMGIKEFAEAIAEAAHEVKSKKFPFKPKEGKVLASRLVKILEGRKGLETTMKAMDVVLSHHRIFIDAQILTDVRPVFNKKGDSVDAAVIVHNLRIHYSKDSDHKDFFVALDASDIQSLREALDRADRKAGCLQRLLKGTGVSYLDE